MDKKFPASRERLYEMLEYITEYANELGFQQEIVASIQLVAEEALINVITHGYQQETDGDISIMLKETTIPGIEITIVDSGRPFSPESNKIDSPSGKSSEIGGWGLFLIFKIMDKVEYKRDGGKNILKLEKHREDKKF